MINTYYIYYGKDRRQDNDKTKRAITTKILITTKPTKTTSRVQAQCWYGGYNTEKGSQCVHKQGHAQHNTR